MSIGRITKLAAIAVAALAVGMFLLLLKLNDEVDRQAMSARKTLASDTSALATSLHGEFERLRGEVDYLANRRFMQFWLGGPTATLSNSKLTRTQAAEEDFKRRIETNPAFRQIRVLKFVESEEVESAERIRVEKRADGRAAISKPSKGKTEAGYYKVLAAEHESKRAPELPDDSLYYVSKIELNYERDPKTKQRLPQYHDGAEGRACWTPVVRGAYPIFYRDPRTPEPLKGTAYGFLIINLDFEAIRDDLVRRAGRRDLYLANSSQEFVVHGADPRLEFAADKQKRFPDHPAPQGFVDLAYAKGEKARVEEFLDSQLGSDPLHDGRRFEMADGGHLHLIRVPIADAQWKSRFVTLGLVSHDEARLLAISGRTKFVLGAQFLLFALAGFFLLWLSRRLVKPMERMAEAATAFAEGRPRGPLPIEERAEVGALARALDDMMTRVRTAQQAVEARRKVVLEAVFDAVVSIRPDGSIESANQAAEGTFGYTASEMRGMTVSELVPWSGEGLPPYVERAANADESIELQGKRKSGQTFPMLLGVRKVELPAGSVYTGVVRDITRQKAAEQQLMQSAQDARTAHERAIQANRAMKDYLAEMGHDLRAPLVPMHMAASIMLKKADSYTPDQIRKKCEQIKGAVDHQSRLLTAILDLSRLEAGKIDIDPKPLSVEETLRKAVQAAAMTDAVVGDQGANDLAIECPEDIGQVYAVDDHLVRILVNLLTNAHKFTRDGKITISAHRVDRDDGDWVEFRVRDTGQGMTEEQLEGLFQAYGQTKEDRENRKKHGGAGLGLAITQRLCRAMGGDIHAESVVGEGTTFIVTLPGTARAATLEPLPEPGATPAPADGEQYTVLLIDDDPGLRSGVRDALQEEGMRVVTAADASRGLELARAIRPDVITLDIVMRDMDGWQALRRLKSDPELAKIPTIILSIIEERQRGYSLGAVDYITKPFDMEALVSAVWKHAAEAPNAPLLVVDDDPTVRTHLSEMLSSQGFRIVEAEDGQDALEKMAADKPAVILLDLDMPVMNGFEFLQHLRGGDTPSDIPVIVVTGLDLDAEQVEELREKVTNVVRKQAHDIDDLARQIRDAVGGYRREDPA